MQYYVQSRFYWLRSLIIYILVAVIFVCIDLIGITDSLQHTYMSLTKPVAQVSANSAFWINDNIEQINGMWSSSAQVSRLERENAVLQAEVAQFESIKKENLALKALLGDTTQQQIQKNKKIATVIGYASPTITSESGVFKTGGLVISEDTLLGVITDVFENQAKVELLSSSQTKPLLVRSESGAEGIIAGNNRLIVMTDIPKDMKVKAGEKVTTIGQDGVPAAIFIGTVGEVIEAPTSPVLTYTVTQPVSFFSTTIVEIR